MAYLVKNNHGQILQQADSLKTWAYPHDPEYCPELIENLDRALRLADITDGFVCNSQGKLLSQEILSA